MPTSKLLPIALALLLTACTTTQIDRQSNITLPENFQHTGQADSSPKLARWWQQWPDPQLGRLIEQGLQHNHSIAIARSRLEEARATSRLAEANLLPSTGLAADAKGYRNHRRDPYLGNGGKLTSASFRAAWEPDIFGQKRSDADAARAAALGSQEQLHGSRLLVSAQIAEHYLRAAHIQQQQTLVSQQLATLHELARYATGRFNAGHATAHDTTAITAQIQALQAQFNAQQRSIAVLIGQTPQTFRLDSNAMRQAALLQHLPSPPQGIRPGSLLNQRPDLRARAAEIQARSAQLASAKQQVRNDRQLFCYGRKTLDTALQSQLGAHSFSQNLLDNQLASGLNLLNLYKAIGSGWQEIPNTP
ncbi:TolC family protein [Neisseria sp. P0008.S010]|uniref:TolC family protein n=1 Tax=Neisseria sp. P0008.S010 TaxID=3436707 RepID=UPI003F7F53E6